MNTNITRFAVFSFILSISSVVFSQTNDILFKEALANGRLTNEGFNRCIRYVNGWSRNADLETKLIPRNINDSRDYWNAWDAAADNYPFMVLTSAILMRRTTTMYCLWKTQGIVPAHWKEDLQLGAVANNKGLYITISCPSGWKGKLVFDSPRFKDKMHYPVDYPRINQYQQWYTIDSEKKYVLRNNKTGKTQTYSGKELISGITVSLKSGEELHLILKDG